MELLDSLVNYARRLGVGEQESSNTDYLITTFRYMANEATNQPKLYEHAWRTLLNAIETNNMITLSEIESIQITDENDWYTKAFLYAWSNRNTSVILLVHHINACIHLSDKDSETLLSIRENGSYLFRLSYDITCSFILSFVTPFTRKIGHILLQCNHIAVFFNNEFDIYDNLVRFCARNFRKFESLSTIAIQMTAIDPHLSEKHANKMLVKSVGQTNRVVANKDIIPIIKKMVIMCPNKQII